jgi:predicted DCC family thiol-disulfide oxidoreductase YuxK
MRWKSIAVPDLGQDLILFDGDCVLCSRAAHFVHRYDRAQRFAFVAIHVTAESGELIAFAFIYNGTDRWNARLTIDAMGPTLASFVRR